MNIRCCALIAVIVLRAACAFGQSEHATVRRAFGGIQPAISPDGNVIALSFQGSICRMPSEGGTLTRLSVGEGADVEPAWSPDGKQIAFIRSPAFYAGVFRMIRAD